MGEAVMGSLEDIAYLAAHCDSVEERRQLDQLLQDTSTEIEPYNGGGES